MGRLQSLAVRTVSLVLTLILALQVLQPQSHIASAQAPGSLAVSKSVINVSTGIGPGGSVTAVPGNTLEYILSFGTVGTGTASGLTLTDSLQAGQTYVPGSCTPTPCATSGSTLTFGPYSSATAGQATFNVTVNPGFSGTLANQFTATATNTTPTTATSNATSVTVGATGPATGTLTVEKQVANISRGGGEATGISAQPGDRVRFYIQVSAGATGSGGQAVTVTDTLQPGLTFFNNCSVTCSNNTSTNTVTLQAGSVSPGTSATVTFDATVNASTNGQIIPNTAVASGTNTNGATSNTAYVAVGNASPPPVTVPPPCTTGCGSSPCSYSCTSTPVTCPYSCYWYPPYYAGYNTCGYYYACGGCSSAAYGCVGSAYSGTVTVCGMVQTYTAPTATSSGQITINGEAFLLMPYLVASGSSISAGSSYCFTLTLNAYCQITSMVVSPNVAATNYVCGTVSPYSYGYAPYAGYVPSGWAPYPGYSPYTQVTSPGPYPLSGGMYGYSGPLVIGGYPFQVSSQLAFPFSMSYGNPYCFLQNNTGVVTGSLSVVPTAASAVETPSGTRHSHGAGSV